MNEQAQQVLVDSLERALNGVDAVVGFGQQKLPEVMEQLLFWHSIKSAAGSFIGLVIVFFSIWLFFYFMRVERADKKEKQETGEKYIDGTVIFSLISIIVASIGVAVMAASSAWFKIMVAPDLYLLEYAASLVK